jgi:large subunit ribosomal protein L29
MYKAKELRDQSIEELEAIYTDSCKQLFLLNNKRAIEKGSQAPHEAKHVRKDIARILTIKSEKQRQAKSLSKRG